ncbi:uncharacterized protein EKO05_0003833 [Ascochyta rabiei]|nr:uncharacterized protein EKO05_0003833 [Ascochyta rabiei]UPX13317.1 hypothetical protein EKO05_0003833 [Ascochyta rabiei]
MADASIRAAPSLLESLKYDPAVIVTVAEAELCLVWYTLGAKDPKIKEWWCRPSIQELATTESSSLSHKDVDAALADCKYRLWLKHNTTLDSIAVLGMSPDYYLHYTRFCLDTFFLPQASSRDTPETSIRAVTRCVESALSVLNLSSRIGPAGKDQLRYFPGFLFVMLSYCSTFVLKAIQAYPDTVPNSAAALDTVRRIADFMVDLGLERGHGGDAFAAGQSVLQEIFRIQRGSQAHPPTQQPSPTPTLLHNEQAQGEQQWLQDVFDQQFLDSGYSFPRWDERFNFG